MEVEIDKVFGKPRASTPNRSYVFHIAGFLFELLARFASDKCNTAHSAPLLYGWRHPRGLEARM
ncbi:MAG: hypothetical protein WA970_25195 [Gammaproteobacteria bacterium]